MIKARYAYYDSICILKRLCMQSEAPDKRTNAYNLHNNVCDQVLNRVFVLDLILAEIITSYNMVLNLLFYGE